MDMHVQEIGPNSAPEYAYPSVGPPLKYDEVQQLVEKASVAIQLKFDGDSGSQCNIPVERPAPGRKGRFLIARHAINVGDIVLSEKPLFHGTTDGAQSRKVYVQDFVALADIEQDDEDSVDIEEDCLHPCSSLVDCMAGILLAKHQALHSDDPAMRMHAKLCIQQLKALCHTGMDLMPEGWAQDLFDNLPIDFQNITSQEELHEFLHILSSNRFDSFDSWIDLMFAGSMFEHSCSPNCFASTWCSSATEHVRMYRALRNIAEGEALSIDYLVLPDSYLPTAARAEILSNWGFTCTCPRCTTLPEITRAFVCPACGNPELCPQRPNSDAEFLCRFCGTTPDATYIKRCLAREIAITQREELAERDASKGTSCQAENTELISRFHHAAFKVMWAHFSAGFQDESCIFKVAVESLIQCVTRLYNNAHHPQMLDLYHTLAELAHNNLDAQRYHLDFEFNILRRYYPEEADKQDAEILALIQGRGRWSQNTHGFNMQLNAMD